MTAPLSQDLRKRLVRAIEEGSSIRRCRTSHKRYIDACTAYLVCRTSKATSRSASVSSAILRLFHMDIAKVQTAGPQATEGQRKLLSAAIDRTSKYAVTQLVYKTDRRQPGSSSINWTPRKTLAF